MKILLSAVSGQFKACRDKLRSDLSAVGAEVVVQEDFQQHGASLLEKLERYIASCDRIIALVGDAYGFEPEKTARPASQPRRSYTQWEYYFAMGERLDGSRQPPKDIFLYIGSPEFLAMNPVSQVADAAQLQQEFITELVRSGKDRNQFGSLHELRALVLRDGFRLQTRVPGIFLPPEPEDFVGRAEALEKLYALVVEKQGRALVHGEPGSGKSTLALKFAWVGQGTFDAVVFQVCGQRPVAEVVAELAAKLKLGVETRPPQEQIAAAKGWLAQRRTLLVLDDIWEDDVMKELVLGPPVSLLCTSRRRSLLPWISLVNSLEVKSFSRDEAESIFRIYLGDETTEKHRDALLGFAKRVERLPIAVVVGADMLRRELDPVPEAVRGLRLERLRNEVHDVAALLRRAINARSEGERRLLYVMAICSPEGFWFPLTLQIAGLNEADGRDARNRLVNASLLRILDRDRQRFQIHGLLREELRSLAPLGELQAAHAEALEGLFRGWEERWRECRECLPEVIPALQHLRDKNESNRAAWLSYWGFATGKRIGELEIALRILQQEEALWLELGDKDSLQRSYGNQALILQDWGRLEEAFELLKKQEALCLELGNRSSLAYCYWSWGLLAREQHDRNTEREKLTAALDIFSELNMPRERDAVRAELEKTTADRAN